MLVTWTRMWRLVGACIGVALVFVIAGQLTPTYAQLPHRVALSQQITMLQRQGTPNDIVPVIIQLQYATPAFAGMYPSASEKIATLAAVAQQETAFVQRNKQVIQRIKGTTKTIPVVFAQIRRSDLESLLYDKQIASITLDEPLPPLLAESTEMITAHSAVVAGYDGSGTSVAVLDTGVAKNHVFLSGQVVAEACFSSTLTVGSVTSYSLCPGGVSATSVTDSGLPCPSNLVGCSHGTHVSGIIAGKRQSPPMLDTWNDSLGNSHTSEVHGVAPGSKIIAIKIFSRFPASYCGGGMDCVLSWTSDQIAALDWLYNNATTPTWGTLAAVNMSLGGGIYAGACDGNAIKQPIDMLRSIGVATVIASGNNGATGGVSAPGCVSSAITVGASASNKLGYTPDTVASFSNAPAPEQNDLNANGDRVLDLLAPGLSIYSSYAYPINQFSRSSGTSMATPHVAGAWAILKSIHPSASVSDILQWFRSSGAAVDANRDATIQLALPRIDVNAAVTQALDPDTMATQTMQIAATRNAQLTATMNAAPTQTALAQITQTIGGVSTATSAARQTQTALIRQTQTVVAQLTQTSALERTVTVAAQRTATVAAQQTATVVSNLTRTAIAQNTRTAAMANTQTVAVQRTETSALQRTSTAIQRQTDTAVAYTTRTAVMALTQTAIADRNATTVAGRTQTAEIVNPTNTAVMALTRTAASELTQTANTIRTATTEWQRTATAAQRQTDTANYYMTRTVVVAITQTNIADRSATAMMGRTQTAEIVNPTNTAVMALTRTAASELTQTAYAVRTATTEWQRTVTAVARQTDAAIFYMTRTAVIAITQTDIADRSATAIMGRTQTAEIVNPTNTAVMALTRTAARELTQTANSIRTETMAVIRTGTAEVNQTNTAIANSTRTANRALTQTALAERYTAQATARTATAGAVYATYTAIATQRTATAMVQQTSTSEARQTNTAAANLTRTVVLALTQTAAVEKTMTALIARTASREAWNYTATASRIAWNATATVTAQTAVAARTQTAAAVRTQTALAQITPIPIGSTKRTPTPPPWLTQFGR